MEPKTIKSPSEVSRGPAELDWQPKHGFTFTPRLTFLANSLVFEFKKATIKWRRGFISSAKRKICDELRRQRKWLNTDGPNRDSAMVLELFTHLSSIFPGYEADLSCDAGPDRLHSHCHNTKNLLNLDDTSLVKIAQLMDGRTVVVFAQVCSRLRELIRSNIASLKRNVSATYEIFIDFNKQTKQDDVRALKCGRSVVDASYYGRSLNEVIPSILMCQLRITFGNNVEVPRWVNEVYRLYKEDRIRPIALIFSGGSFLEGADLRCFVEDDFIGFVRVFVPHLKEVQLATSRLFGFDSFPRFLFSMINLLSLFGITYEEPSVRHSIEDIGRVVHLWRFSPRAHSCDIFMNHYYGCNEVNWLLYGGKTTTEGSRVTGVTVQHALLEDVILPISYLEGEHRDTAFDHYKTLTGLPLLVSQSQDIHREESYSGSSMSNTLPRSMGGSVPKHGTAITRFIAKK